MNDFYRTIFSNTLCTTSSQFGTKFWSKQKLSRCILKAVAQNILEIRKKISQKLFEAKQLQDSCLSYGETATESQVNKEADGT